MVLTKDGMRPIAERRQEVTLRLPPTWSPTSKRAGRAGRRGSARCSSGMPARPGGKPGW